jgi:hypothetical protein
MLHLRSSACAAQAKSALAANSTMTLALPGILFIAMSQFDAK